MRGGAGWAGLGCGQLVWLCEGPLRSQQPPSLPPVQCDPPSDLQSNMSASKCRLQWKKPAAYSLIDSFHWELAFKATADPWEVRGGGGHSRGKGLPGEGRQPKGGSPPCWAQLNRDQALVVPLHCPPPQAPG